MDKNSSQICGHTRASDHILTVFASQNVVLPGRVGPATLVICQATGKITAIFNSIVPPSKFSKRSTYVDYQSSIIMPGLVDTHVHLNEPGRTSSEGFFTGTQAAASGGITTVIDMPLNSIPATTSVANLKTKMRAARDKCWVDVGFLGGMIPGNTKELRPMMKAGVRGFKGFLIDSGVSSHFDPQVLWLT
jgi:allantoinase